MRQQRIIRSIVAVIVLVLATAYSVWQREAGDDHSSTQVDGTRSPAAFDYYLASLSWSPSYCESNPDDRDQCGRRGYGFILHGLWPQYDRGGGPQDCPGGAQPDRKTVERALAFMPSRGLVGHEWRTHGRCSGLDPDDYFDLADRAFAAIRIPSSLTAASTPPPMSADEVRSAFVDANPGMSEDMLAVTCHRNTLSEVRVCLSKELRLKSCGRGVRMRCPGNTELRIPLIR